MVNRTEALSRAEKFLDLARDRDRSAHERKARFREVAKISSALNFTLALNSLTA